ncbi:MAG: hypothetical protein EXR72_24125 [Myxococcales bacterium]|nr:hypothetical protein [Myxococcales bacterium]
MDRPPLLALVALLLAANSAGAERPVLPSPPPLPPAAAAWSLVKTVEGISVRTAPSEERAPWGSAEGRMEVAPEAVLDHLLGFEALTKAIPYLAEVRVLRRSEGEALVYFYFDLPWPLSNRDYTVRYRWAHEGAQTVVTTEDANDLGPPATSAVRVRRVRTRWELAPKEGGTQARFVCLVDYGGMLTQGMIEQTAWKQPMQTFLAVRKVLLPH